MATDNLTLGRGKVFFAPYAPSTTTGGTKAYFGNTPNLGLAQTNTKLDHYSSEGGLKIKDRSILLQTDVNLTFDTDNIDVGNLILFFGGLATGTLPSDAPAGLGTVVVIGKQNAIYGALTFEADNPVGDNYNYWFPYVMLAPTGTMALKGDAWQVLNFMADALKRDAQTERMYVYRPTTGNTSAAAADTTPFFTPAGAAVGSGGTPPTGP